MEAKTKTIEQFKLHGKDNRLGGRAGGAVDPSGSTI